MKAEAHRLKKELEDAKQQLGVDLNNAWEEHTNTSRELTTAQSSLRDATVRC
jgi:hypothetical protein